MISSFRFSEYSFNEGRKVSLISCNLFPRQSFHLAWKSEFTYLHIRGFKSEKGYFMSWILAIVSAFSFPLIPIWPGNQQNSILDPTASKYVRIWTISRIIGCSKFLPLSACKQERESEYIKFVCKVWDWTYCTASFKATASAVKIELSVGRFTFKHGRQSRLMSL